MPSQYVGISDDDQNKLLIGDDGSITVTGSLSSGGTVAQGTPAVAGSGWPVKVTDGTNTATVDATTLGLGVLVRNTSNVPVQVSGTVPITGAVSQGGAASIGGEWPVKISNATNTTSISAPTAGIGNGLKVETGNLAAVATLTTATAISNGTTVDFGSAHTGITLALVPNGTITGGDVDLQLSQDNVNWITVATTAGVGITTGVNKFLNASVTVSATTDVEFPAARYARGRIIATITGGGSVTATIAAP